MSGDHGHEGFDVPFDDPLGRPVDRKLLGDFVGAAFDGCASCQDALLTLMVDDAATVTRLVELACLASAEAFGGLPPKLTDPDVPGLAAPEFREMARAGAGGQNTRMLALCEQMTPAQRRAAANTAADLLAGLLMGGM